MRTQRARRRTTMWGAAAAVAALALTIGAPPASAESVAEPESSRSADELQIRLLKAAILGVSERAQGTCDEDDNSRVVAAVVNTLTDRLVAVAGERTEPEKLPEVAGGWQQVWADLDTGRPGCTRADQIYQVVSPDGFYWNIAEEQPLGGGRTTLGFLRGKYEVTPEFLPIEFTDQAVSPVVPPPGTDVIDLANRAENGEFTPLPDGPTIGVTGELQNVYVDEDLRIVRGSVDEPGASTDVFVLVRTDVTT